MSPIHNKAIAYRPEVDGLRTIAVLPVILFHAGFEFFSGGYVGVDIFFVISGYLITLIILREMESGNFSVIRFYERRARRILPALIAVIAVCLPFAWILMLPNELKRFGQSLVAVATFSSNIFFWRNTDYFSPAAEEQPLLHIWSLAVEEQYYVLFPLFLMIGWRFGKSRIFLLTALTAGSSLLLAEWWGRSHPVGNFFLLPTRAWELLAGSMLAFIPASKAVSLRTGKFSELGSLIGLGLIAYSIVGFDSNTRFPSIYALLPVIGASLVIACASKNNLTGRLLSTRIFVAIGLVSYSAYLWHQPIFAFIRIYYVESPSGVIFLLGSVASLLLAWFSWKFIETPFRQETKTRKIIFSYSGVTLGLMVFLGLGFNLANGFDYRFQKFSAWKFVNTSPEKQMEVYRRGTCFIDYHQDVDVLHANGCIVKGFSEPQVILAGDSMAAHYLHEVGKFGLKLSLPVSQINGTSCRPYIHSNMSDRCKHIHALLLDSIKMSPSGSFIFISANWQGEFRIEREIFNKEVKNLLDIIYQSNAHVVIIGQSPNFASAPSLEMLRSEFVGNSFGTQLISDGQFVKVNAFLKTLIAERNQFERNRVIFIDPTEGLCGDGAACTVLTQGVPVFIDTGHFTPFGASVAVGSKLKADKFLIQ